MFYVVRKQDFRDDRLAGVEVDRQLRYLYARGIGFEFNPGLCGGAQGELQ
jgi:hypothetical protein